MRKQKKTYYYQDPDAICSECGEHCGIIPLDNSFDYAGTHCTGGVGGTHYPQDFGEPVGDCCEAEIEGCTPEADEPW